MKRWTCFYICLIIILLLIGCKSNQKEIQANTISTQTIEEPQNGVKEELKTEESKKTIFLSPLTGLALDNEGDTKIRPIAVMIDNEVSARPQSGLMNADIVYEIPVEGNITRYMAVFTHLETQKIGPVRSARPYFLDKAMEFGAVYVHCGGSPQALLDIEELKIDALNDLKGSPCFWRATDKKMPHNLYTCSKYMRELLTKYEWENNKTLEYFKFNEDFHLLDGRNSAGFEVDFGNNYRAGFLYDANEKIYNRYVNGQVHVDKETKETIKATNIIIERLNIKVLDKAGRLSITNIGKDRGYYFTGGKMIEIEWYKDSRRGKTVYKDLHGNELQLNKGKTWIEVVPYTAKTTIRE